MVKSERENSYMLGSNLRTCTMGKHRKSRALAVNNGRPRLDAVAAKRQSATPTRWARWYCSIQASAQKPASGESSITLTSWSVRNCRKRWFSFLFRDPCPSSMRVMTEIAFCVSPSRALTAFWFPLRHQMKTPVSIKMESGLPHPPYQGRNRFVLVSPHSHGGMAGERGEVGRPGHRNDDAFDFSPAGQFHLCLLLRHSNIDLVLYRRSTTEACMA